MELQPRTATCIEPELAQLAGPYCFDELEAAARVRFEAHLLACESCWSAVQRLSQHVEVLDSDRRLAEVAMTPQTLGVLGLSGALDLPSAGHRLFAVAGSVMFALLFAVPVVVEVAYEFDRFGRVAMTLAPLAFVWMFAAGVATFWLDVRETRRAAGAFWKVLSLLAVATAILCVALLPRLPVDPTVQANFQTYPVRLGYMKSVFYAWMVGPWLVFWPFHFVLSMQAQLAMGRHQYVLNLLNREKTVVSPRGLPFVPVWVMGGYVMALFVFNWIGVSHLFDNLRPGPRMSLFMTTVLVRVTVWLSLAAVGALWYWTSLTELKRECLAVLSLTRGDAGRSGPPSRGGDATTTR